MEPEYARELRRELNRATAQRDALLRYIRDEHPVCAYCEAAPVCVGNREGGELLVTCGEHCGHGCGDALCDCGGEWCLMLPTEDDDGNE